MKMKTALYGLVTGLAACLVTGAAMTQETKVDDSVLLNLLEAVDAQSKDAQPKAYSSDPVDRAKATAGVAGERAAEADDVDVVAAEAPADETDAVETAHIDSLEMGTVDESVASAVGNLISVRLNKVGLEEAINLFAQLSGANIIVPELTEAAQISVNLKDVEWRPALQSILDTYNYELYQRVSGSNVYSVRRRPAGAPEPQVVETFLLKYATVPNAAELIRGLLPSDAKVSEFASRNMIVVKSSESSLSEVRSVLDTIDTVRQQVYIESKFMELSDDAQKDLGIDWKVLQGFSGGTVGSVQHSFSKTYSDQSERSSFTDSLGRPYAEGSSFTDGATLDGNFPVYEGLTPALKKVTQNGTTEILTSVLDIDQFRLVLSALEDNKGVNVVSNPKIIVANEESANISIVRKEPNLKQERQQALNDTPDTITFTLDKDEPFFEYGVKLDVTPSINTSSNITVQIVPSLTSKFGDKDAGDNTYPIIDEKTIQTVFSLASGQTAAIGGLTKVTDSEIERKVPLLGSLPLLGRLFSYNQTVHGQSETIIFVTVGLANTQNIDHETGMPQDAELARRRVIINRNARAIRDETLEQYEAIENAKLQKELDKLHRKGEKRLEKSDNGSKEAGDGVGEDAGAPVEVAAIN